MTMSLDQARDHATRVLDVVRKGARSGMSEVVAASWERCVNDYRLSPDQQRDPVEVGAHSLASRQARLADLIDSARFEMTTLFQQLADDESAVLLTDTDGVILHLVATEAFSAEMGPLGLRPGAVWSETVAGTNGMGTCLASGTPVAVQQEDHFFSRLKDLTCSAVPIYDPAGRIAGVLDVTSRSTVAPQHLLVLLGMAARMIENRWIDQRFSTAHPLQFHTRPELVYTLHEGRLAVAEDGHILAANRSALLQLGVPSVDLIRERTVDDLFQSSWSDLLNRSAGSAFHPVVTYAADAGQRFFAVARPRASAAGVLSVQVPPVTSRRGEASALAAAQPATSPTVVFEDPRLQAHLRTAARVIARQTPVLLAGETGSGKEVLARAVHEASPHAHGPFVAVNCASLPESLIESELFGYRAGAFTGAQRSGRRGKVLQADGGTLFLDEIGDMPLDLQARLLRVLDERVVTPLGSEETHPVSFQLISASHRHLPKLVAEGRFREDLYYRLAGIELALPPLRERSDREAVIDRVVADEGGRGARLSADARRLLLAQPWPGNLRQLRFVIRTACALADGGLLKPEHFPSLTGQACMARGAGNGEGAGEAAPCGTLGNVAAANAIVPPTPAEAAAPAADPAALPAHARLNAIQVNERRVLLQLLEQHRWNLSAVAKGLDVSRNTLYRKLRKLHIEFGAVAPGG